MPEHEATVEISTGRSTFKVSGSEKFIEKMIVALPAAFPAEAPAPKDTEREDAEPDHKGNGAAATLDEFVKRAKITNEMADTKKATAFVVYLSGNDGSCTIAQIEECFDKTGLKTPTSLRNAVGNASKDTGKGALIRSAGRGLYAPTTHGKNLVKELMQ